MTKAHINLKENLHNINPDLYNIMYECVSTTYLGGMIRTFIDQAQKELDKQEAEIQRLTELVNMRYINYRIVITKDMSIQNAAADRIQKNFNLAIIETKEKLRSQRHQNGLCLECGDEGEIKNMASICRNNHGKIWG